jgi:hypothetical protein
LIARYNALSRANAFFIEVHEFGRKLTFAVAGKRQGTGLSLSIAANNVDPSRALQRSATCSSGADSGIRPVRNAITGVPQAIASMSVNP